MLLCLLSFYFAMFATCMSCIHSLLKEMTALHLLFWEHNPSPKAALKKNNDLLWLISTAYIHVHVCFMSYVIVKSPSKPYIVVRLARSFLIGHETSFLRYHHNDIHCVYAVQRPACLGWDCNPRHAVA